MVEEEQEKAQKDFDTALTAIVSPLADAIAANQAAIKKLANRNPPKVEPLLPPEVTKLLPGLINGVIKIFTTPDSSPAEASKGIFDKAMMEAYKKSTIAIWEMNAKMTQANLDSVTLENELRRKRLTEEF